MGEKTTCGKGAGREGLWREEIETEGSSTRKELGERRKWERIGFWSVIVNRHHVRYHFYYHYQ